MRVLHYSHDTSGSEHIENTLAIAEQVALDFPQATQLLVTDTPQPRSTKLPHKLDFIKLPSFRKFPEGGFHNPSLSTLGGVAESLHGELILNAIKHFRPDVIFVNKVNGTEAELAPSLSYLRLESPETRLTVGMDNLKDDALMVRNALLASKEGNPRHTLSRSSNRDYRADYYEASTSRNMDSQVLVAA